MSRIRRGGKHDIDCWSSRCSYHPDVGTLMVSLIEYLKERNDWLVEENKRLKRELELLEQKLNPRCEHCNSKIFVSDTKIIIIHQPECVDNSRENDIIIICIHCGDEYNSWKDLNEHREVCSSNPRNKKD